MEPSDKKKWILIGAPIVAIALAAGVWLLLSGNRAELHESLPSKNGILSISNVDNANLTILTAQIDTIIVDLQGPADQVGKARFYSDNPQSSKFDLPEDWGGLSGTITVPQGTLIELKPSKNTPVIITDKNGERPGASGNTLLVDSTHLTKILTGKSGIGISGNGSVAVEDEGLHGSADNPGDSGTGGGLTGCGFGAQMLRDRCCARQKEEASTPACPGKWTYDNTKRLCEYECTAPDQPIDNTGGQNGEYGGNGGGTGGGGTEIPPLPGAAPQDPTSQQCMSYSGEARSLCCDERLRNPLRIGPRAGFPDCLGKWHFDPRILNCRFQCADYGEMLEILNELKLDQIPQ